MPTSDRATQKQILDAIVERLRDKVDDLGDTNCFASDQRQPVSWPPDHHAVTVSVGGGRFPEPFYASAGALTLCEQTTVAVTVWLHMDLDRSGRVEEALLSECGLISDWKPDILRALLITEDDDGNPIPWHPVGEDGLGLLRNMLAPLSCSDVFTDAAGEWIGMTLTFGVDFDWRL